MRYTNKLNLPHQIVKALENDEHRMADFSATQLLKGSTEIALEMVNRDALEMDASDAINLLLGKAVHKVLEEQETDNVLNEHYMTARSFAGFTVSGCADVIDCNVGMIKDYKTCSTWKVIYKDFDDWREQGKAYCYLWNNESGELYTKFQIVALLKDFSQTQAERDSSYPQSPIMTINFDYTYEEIMGVGETWEGKIKDVLYEVSTGFYGVCSNKERWHKDDTWAVMKKGRKSAVKVFDNKSDALKMIVELGNDYSIEERIGEDVKCDRYCVVGKCGFCEYRNRKEESK